MIHMGWVDMQHEVLIIPDGIIGYAEFAKWLSQGDRRACQFCGDSQFLEDPML